MTYYQLSEWPPKLAFENAFSRHFPVTRMFMLMGTLGNDYAIPSDAEERSASFPPSCIQRHQTAADLKHFTFYRR